MNESNNSINDSLSLVIKEKSVLSESSIKIVDSTQPNKLQKSLINSLVLKEGGINMLKFNGSDSSEIRAYLLTTFGMCCLNTGIGIQDGPDFWYIEYSHRELNIFFAISLETGYITEVVCSGLKFKDEYNISVGDSYDKLIAQRNGKYKIAIDMTQRVYVIYDNSRIWYELDKIDNFGDYLREEYLIEVHPKDIKGSYVKSIQWQNSEDSFEKIKLP